MELYNASKAPLNMFAIVFVLRLVTGLFSLATLAVFVRAVLPTIAGEAEKRAFVRYLPLFGFLPYLFVRTSSETLSAAFFALGLALTLGEKSTRRLMLAGLFCGLAFECRYQTALLGAGLLAWLAVIAAAARRITLYVPIRLTWITLMNDSSGLGPVLPSILSATAMPAHWIEPCTAP